MEHLRLIGKTYNDYCEIIDSYKADYKKTKAKAEKEIIKQKIKEKKNELKEYRKTLSKEEKEVYRDYQKIRFDIKRCEILKKADKIESKIFKKVNPAYIYMIPAAFGAIFFTILPAIFMVIGSFFKVDLVSIWESSFRGFWNYEMIFTRDTEFVKAIWNTIIFAFFTVFLLMIITLLMASWLSKNTKIHNLSQTMIFTPHIASMVSVSILWILMLDPQGIINQILSLLGIEGPNWLMNTKTSLLSVGFVTVWKSIGYYVLIIIAGLQSIPAYVYEAARLDKASKFTIFRKITVPLLSETLMFVFIMKFINSFKSFAAIDLMTQGGPRGSSMVLGYWIYNAGRVKFNYGFAMAGALILTIIVALFTVLANQVFKKKVE
ncbi:MAG TPA: sugar ABC transporter permease [Bacilli bacterium]|jgi:sn-glycerol 3-phosphate transport system permease protein|nr:sugar ABC transporter permease [Acholeplasmataceae bacterium]HNZ77817.1 sugar ABC transporter permease [Bacilli bacterium]HOD60914.1 sugar ABC transporter permease [Bacilli bacterium]HOH61076.1 sugar ABC transporter permease [Bacilli bacterium]HPB48710.1 sugar ABC transporter permease [Bacilli bacterium]